MPRCARRPDGKVTDEVHADGFDAPLAIRCTARRTGEDIVVDRAGTNALVDEPTSSVMDFAVAHSAHAITCAFDAQAPDEAGPEG